MTKTLCCHRKDVELALETVLERYAGACEDDWVRKTKINRLEMCIHDMRYSGKGVVWLGHIRQALRGYHGDDYPGFFEEFFDELMKIECD